MHNFFTRLRKVIAQSFANERPRVVGYEWFSDHEVAAYDRAFATSEPTRIDDATWRDLDTWAYLRVIGSRASIFGRQILYRRLRVGRNETGSSVSPLSHLANPFTDAVLAQTEVMRDTLRRVDTDITQTLFHGQFISVPHWTSHLWMVPCVGVALLLFLRLHPGYASALLLFGYFAFSVWTQIKLYLNLTRWKSQRDAVIAMLLTALKLGDAGQRIPHPILGGMAQIRAEVERLVTLLSPTWIERNPIVAEYANLLVLYEYAMVGKKIDRLRAHLPALRTVYEQLGECEAQICLVEHLKMRALVCLAHQSDVRSMHLCQMVNPLLHKPDPLSIQLCGKGAFITGQNGVGKSTFLRGVGLNVLAGRAFGFCYAESAELPFLPVWSSIQNEDSLQTADSLYMAEMRRAETLLKVAQSPTGAIFIIDEIFRGTNNIESVAAAAAVIDHLAKRATVIVSSHNLVLAPILKSKLDALRIVRAESGANSLQLESGLLTETNGIQMMENYAFPDSVRTNAGRIHDWFAGYVTRPESFPKLL